MAKNNKKKSGSGWLTWVWVIVILGGLLRSITEDGDVQRLYWRFRVWLSRSGLRMELVLPVLLLIVAVLVIAFASRGSVKQAEGKKQSGAIHRKDPRSQSFTKPETYCAVHDHSGEDHLAHDKAQRIAQLDEWLKIGLIDKAEYRVLKDRYQKDL